MRTYIFTKKVKWYWTLSYLSSSSKKKKNHKHKKAYTFSMLRATQREHLRKRKFFNTIFHCARNYVYAGSRNFSFLLWHKANANTNNPLAAANTIRKYSPWPKNNKNNQDLSAPPKKHSPIASINPFAAQNELAFSLMFCWSYTCLPRDGCSPTERQPVRYDERELWNINIRLRWLRWWVVWWCVEWSYWWCSQLASSLLFSRERLFTNSARISKEN